MPAGAKAVMRALVAVEVDLERIGIEVFVDADKGDQAKHHVAGFHRDAAELHVFGDLARQGREGVAAHQFFDSLGDALGIGG